MPCPSRASLLSKYSSELSQLQRGLPVRFRPTLDYLISMLPRLLADDWPLVPNHTDLLENNIHVSTETGRIAGICDWKDTDIGPFGMSLGGLETMLGTLTRSRGWCYHVKQQELRDLFWETLYQAMGNVSEEQRKLIEVARLVGLFLANGFEWKDGAKVPASEECEELRYLEAVTLTLWHSGGKQVAPPPFQPAERRQL
jgi:Phosphotransferase enzyme family